VPSKRLTVAQRQEIFQELVQVQDTCPVRESRQIITQKYDITEHLLRNIEEEGLEREWPPLGDLDVSRRTRIVRPKFA
jgi:hypothetical protein